MSDYKWEPVPPIERDESMGRTYIPLPGGWEIQTRGKGSTFRICNTKTHKRQPFLIPDHQQEFLEQMAREIHAATTAPVVPPAAAPAVTKSHDELALLRRSISAQLLFLFDRNCRVVGNTLELPFDSHDHAFKQLMQARQLCEILSAQQETPR